MQTVRPGMILEVLVVEYTPLYYGVMETVKKSTVIWTMVKAGW